jgi:hypothetical protein
MFSKSRDHHTINELMYVLNHDERLKDFNINISILKLDRHYTCIPCVDAFVDIHTLSIWFSDDSVEFEREEFNGAYYDNITVQEVNYVREN